MKGGGNKFVIFRIAFQGGQQIPRRECLTDFELENKYTGMAAYMFVGVSLQSVTDKYLVSFSLLEVIEKPQECKGQNRWQLPQVASLCQNSQTQDV